MANPYDFSNCPNYDALQSALAVMTADPSKTNKQAYMAELKTALAHTGAKFQL